MLEFKPSFWMKMVKWPERANPDLDPIIEFYAEFFPMKKFYADF